MPWATGSCFLCGKSVPDESLNRFYCSDGCRGAVLARTLEQEDRENGKYDDDLDD